MGAAVTGVAQARNFVNGKWVESAGTRTVERRNPANSDDIVGAVTLSTREETRAAVDAAVKALPGWRDTPPLVRGKIIAKAAQVLAARIDEVAACLTREEGKTLSEAKGEITRSINVLEYMAGEAKRLGGETLPSELPKNFAYTIRQP